MKNTDTEFSGILNIYKPVGITSFSVISRLRKIFGMKKIGHCGTLDPFACGVLPVCIGKSTRVIQYMDDSSKSYKCVFLFGVSTDTQDCEGEIIGGEFPSDDVLIKFKETNYEALRKLILGFTGDIQQIPPMYSAVKIKGKPLYRYARDGEILEREARPVMIKDIQIKSFFVKKPDFFAYPESLHAEIIVHCSKGTYIRTLCHDIGELSGYGACAIELERLSSGIFNLNDSHTLEEVEVLHKNGEISKILLSESDMLAHIPELPVTEKEAKRLTVGQRLPFSDIAERINTLFPDGDYEGKQTRAIEDGKLIAILTLCRKDSVLSMKIERVFA